MISIDPPSDLSSSSHQQQQQQQQQQQHVSDDLKVSGLDLKFSDADLNDINDNQLPNFSIRDYVFGVRSKDISCNWPFSPTSLQLCLKHGVNNLLPLFESIGSLRNKSCLTRCSLENRLTDEKLVGSFHGKKINEKIALQSVTLKASASEGDRESQVHQTKSKEKDKPQKPENVSTRHNIIKKSRFVTKISLSVEDAAPNSETMTSKVCPVCKMFSSSSNTTLNVHIDQCLIGEGTLKWTQNPKVSVAVKHRVKPRKMRLMVDIYTTAPHCTIEELDRRNGTSWATNSSFPAQEFRFQDEEVEEKEEEQPRRTIVSTEVANNEGDVYIDTDGTKIRILSVPNAGSSDNRGSRKLLKELKRSKIIVTKKKKDLFKKKHHHKYLKLGPNPICPSKPQASSGREGNVAMKSADLGSIRPPWACSKRTGLLKTSSGKNRKVELQSRKPKDLILNNVKLASNCDLGTALSSSDKINCLQNNKKLRISSSLIKQPNDGMVDIRMEATRMREDDDIDDDCADTGSKGRKFPSLSKNPSFPAQKFNLKRKFPAVENCRVKSVDGSSQDSLKERFRMEELATKKEDTRPINSSAGIQNVNLDGFHDGEPVRNETFLSNAPSFMGLSASFDPEFSKQECDELYQDHICSTNSAPNDVETGEIFCQEVDPIPIPGPPGSLLPVSPGAEMVLEEEFQAVMVVSSSENQHHRDHTMDRDSNSDSPVSTVSNSRSTSVQDDKKPFFIGDMGFTENGLSHKSFKHDHQPCCCSRKEAALNFQDSYISRKQAIESDRSIPTGFNFKSEMFSPLTEPVSFPANKNFSVSSDCDSSKPVLRLMGKNLTLAKTDEDEFRPPRSSQPHPQPNLIFRQCQNGSQSQHFNMRSHVDLMPVHGSFMGSMDRYGYGGPYLGRATSQTRSHHGHNALNFQSVNGRNVYNAASSSKPVNEIIIIDDPPEKEEAGDSMQNPSNTMFPSYGSGNLSKFHGGNFQSSLGKWNIGSPSPSISNLRSSTMSYYPPNYP